MDEAPQFRRRMTAEYSAASRQHADREVRQLEDDDLFPLRDAINREIINRGLEDDEIEQRGIERHGIRQPGVEHHGVEESNDVEGVEIDRAEFMDHVNRGRNWHGQSPQPGHGTTCANCHGIDHVLRECVTNWSPEGDIPGCYRCNTLDHIIDTCPLPRYSAEKAFDIEVYGRSGLPPLRSFRGWNKLALEFNLDCDGPISRQMMVRISRHAFDSWDYNASLDEQEHLLLTDPATASLQRIRDLPDQGYQPPLRQQ
ncbi:hypothetical protein Hte_009626 [Hypoxylon texense]